MPFSPLRRFLPVLFCLLFPAASIAADDCSPYVCADGTQAARCSEFGDPIYYFAVPCHNHGGEAGAPFSDVPSGHPNAEAIAYLQAEGIAKGYPDGTFRPDQTINRAEFVKIIVEPQFIWVRKTGMGDHCGASPTTRYFSDVDYLFDWFGDYVCYAVERSLIAGYPDGTFRPAANINFVEAAKITAKEFLLPTKRSDVWYEGPVIALEKKKAIPLSITSLSQNLTRGEMAEIVYRLMTGNTTKPSQSYERLVEGQACTEAKQNAQFALDVIRSCEIDADCIRYRQPGTCKTASINRNSDRSELQSAADIAREQCKTVCLGVIEEGEPQCVAHLCTFVPDYRLEK